MAKSTQANFQMVSIGQIKPNPNNPRVIRDEKFKRLVESIKSFPKMLHIRPIVVNSDMVVLGGNMRLRACQEAELKEIPIIKAEDLNESEQKEFIIKDNASAGEWDFDMLANEWDSQSLKDWGIYIPEESTETESEKTPSGSDDDYSVFELVMLHENKLKLYQAINDVRNNKGIDKIEDALMYIINHYQL